MSGSDEVNKEGVVLQEHIYIASQGVEFFEATFKVRLKEPITYLEYSEIHQLIKKQIINIRNERNAKQPTKD